LAGVKDGLEHEGFAEALSGHEGVPVFFVHVVAGEDGLWVLLAEEDGLFGIALDAEITSVIVSALSYSHYGCVD